MPNLIYVMEDFPMKRVLLFLSLFLVAPVYAQTVVVGSGVESLAGDTTPQLGGDLDVNGNDITSAAGLDIAIGASAGNDFTVDTSKLVVEGDTGRVGIATSSPAQLLDVNGQIIGRNIFSVTAGGGNEVARFTWGGADDGELQLRASGGINTHIRTNGISFFNGGNVGIGTSSPAQLLDVNGQIIGRNIFSVTAGGGNEIARFTWGGSDDGELQLRASGIIKTHIRTNGVSYFNGGNIGIGESTPTAELHITGASTPSLFIESTTATDGGQFILEDTDGAGCTGITALNGVLTATTIACP